jgi:hypothetical protein
MGGLPALAVRLEVSLAEGAIALSVASEAVGAHRDHPGKRLVGGVARLKVGSGQEGPRTRVSGR